MDKKENIKFNNFNKMIFRIKIMLCFLLYDID